jgi:hypothetical protein
MYTGFDRSGAARLLKLVYLLFAVDLGAQVTGAVSGNVAKPANATLGGKIRPGRFFEGEFSLALGVI